MVDRIRVFEPTEEECGIEIVDDGGYVLVEDVFYPGDETCAFYEKRKYSIAKKDIPFIIRGLQEFLV